MGSPETYRSALYFPKSRQESFREYQKLINPVLPIAHLYRNDIPRPLIRLEFF